MVDLRSFIAESIVEITGGVWDAQRDAQRFKAEVNPEQYPSGGQTQQIEFDIAITAAESSTEKKAGGLSIKVITAGAQNEANVANSSVSRIKFCVPVSFSFRKYD